MDAANFCQTLRYGFDLSNYRPHSPGYPILVLLWNILYRLLPISPHTALLIINTIFMMIAVSAIGKTYRLLWGAEGSLYAMLLLAACPVFMYQGCTGEMYVYDAACSLVIFNTFYSITKRSLPVGALLLGLAGGIRPSSIVFLLPLVLWLLWKRKIELKLNVGSGSIVVAAFVLGWCIWLLPLVYSVGSWKAYWLLFVDTTTVDSTIAQNIATLASIALWVVLPSIGFLLYKPSATVRSIRSQWITLLIWVIPAILFFVFRHYAKGYILLIAPAYLLIAVRAIVSNYRNASRTISSIAVVSLLLFLFVPYYQLPVESSFAKANRTSSERIRTAALRLVSTLSSTNARLRAGEAEMEDAMKLIQSIRNDSAMVLIDPSTEPSIARCMQELQPRYKYARFLSYDKEHMGYYWKEINTFSYPADSVFASEELYLLSSSELIDAYRQTYSLSPIKTSSLNALYLITPEQKRIIKQLLNDLYQ